MEKVVKIIKILLWKLNFRYFSNYNYFLWILFIILHTVRTYIVYVYKISAKRVIDHFLSNVDYLKKIVCSNFYSSYWINIFWNIMTKVLRRVLLQKIMQIFNTFEQLVVLLNLELKNIFFAYFERKILYVFLNFENIPGDHYIKLNDF